MDLTWRYLFDLAKNCSHATLLTSFKSGWSWGLQSFLHFSPLWFLKCKKSTNTLILAQYFVSSFSCTFSNWPRWTRCWSPGWPSHSDRTSSCSTPPVSPSVSWGSPPGRSTRKCSWLCHCGRQRTLRLSQNVLIKQILQGVPLILLHLVFGVFNPLTSIVDRK